MQVSTINYNIQQNNIHYKKSINNIKSYGTPIQNVSYSKFPVGFQYNANISFGENINRHRHIPNIEFEDYVRMTDSRKKYYRKRADDFNIYNDTSQLIDRHYTYIPLGSEHDMDAFVKTSSIYNQYKNRPIICLGRSPKWFLNASLWMKDGIDKYKFTAFSGYWYVPDYREGVRRIDRSAPKEKEIKAYRRYLKNMKANPESIIKDSEKAGQKAIITDYIYSGKGMTSFLEVLSSYAKDEGVLEPFAKSIEIIGIGCREYMEEMNPYMEEFSNPSTIMPSLLKKYENTIPQTFYDMDYSMFMSMLINQNANECRSTYYPHWAWNLYNPNRFKTGIIKDTRKVEELLKKTSEKTVQSFKPEMLDYRNLLNFRILDGLNERGLLKAVHKTKI